MVKLPRFRLSVDQYRKMIEHGILTESHDVELIRGEIIPKMSKGDLHAWCLKALIRLFGPVVGDQAILSVQDPLYVADSAPEPDFVLLAFRPDLYRSAGPRAADAILVIEVADSSLDYDREVKGPLYAENGIAEYWIVNLVDRCLEVHRQPQADGTYADVQTLRPGDSVTLTRLPAVSVNVSDLIP
jgi:Uma2 family endonuclease